MGRFSVEYQPSDDPRLGLALLAFRQHGVVSFGQLLALGFSRQRVRTLTGNGILHRLFPAVYGVGHTRLTQEGLWIAAVLACGEGALLSHGDAGRLHGLLRSSGAGPIHVSAPGRSRLDGIRCHRFRRLDPLDATIVDAIPVTAWARTALDLAALLPPARLRDALEQAERQERDFSELHSLVDRSSGHHGLRRLRAALGELGRAGDRAPDLRSEAEFDLLALIRAAGLPEPRTNVIVAGELVDFHWPREGLVVEVDGRRWHGLHRDMETDRQKDVRLSLAGVRPVRFTARRIAEAPAAVVREIAALLGLGPSPKSRTPAS